MTNRPLSALLAVLAAAALAAGCGRGEGASPSSQPLPSVSAQPAPVSEPLLMELAGQRLSFPSLDLSLTLEGEWTLLSGEALDQIQGDAAPALGDERLEGGEEAPPLSQKGGMAVEASRSWTLFCALEEADGRSPGEACRQQAQRMEELLTIRQEPQTVSLPGGEGAFFTASYSPSGQEPLLWQTVWAVETSQGLLFLTGSCGREEDLSALEGMIQTLDFGAS